MGGDGTEGGRDDCNDERAEDVGFEDIHCVDTNEEDKEEEDVGFKFSKSSEASWIVVFCSLYGTCLGSGGIGMGASNNSSSANKASRSSSLDMDEDGTGWSRFLLRMVLGVIRIGSRFVRFVGSSFCSGELAFKSSI
jgi:hypothetical protein